MTTHVLTHDSVTTPNLSPSTHHAVDVLGLKNCLKGLNKQLKEMGLGLNFHSEDIEPYLFISGGEYTLTEDKIGEIYARYTTSISEYEEQQKQNIAHLEMEIHHTETVIRELTSQTGKDIRRRLKEARHSALNHGKTSRQYREASVAEEVVLGKFYERGRGEIELELLREKYSTLEKTSQEFARMKIERMEKFKNTLNSIQIPVEQKTTGKIPTEKSISFLNTKRGKITTTIIGILAGTGIAWWNLRDQLSRGENPVNLITRLIKGHEETSRVGSGNDKNFDPNMVLFMENRIQTAKQKALHQLAQNGDVNALGTLLKNNLTNISGIRESDVEIRSIQADNGCPLFAITYTHGKNKYIDTLGPPDICQGIDTWITNQLIAYHFKGDMNTVILTEGYSGDSEQVRQIVIQGIARSSIIKIFEPMMKKNGYTLNTLDSGILWDPRSGRPAFKIVYYFGNDTTQQMLVKRFSELP